MKVAKPIKIAILHRVVEVRRKPIFHVAAMIGAPMENTRALFDEMAFWGIVQKELGEIGVVDEGTSKPCGEMLVAGSFHAPGGKELTASYARASVGSIDKRVAVVGDRYWNGNTPTEPIPFTTMPITWARAFGGPKWERNMHGKGAEPIDVNGVMLQPLPNIEHYGALIRSPNERPEPTGFGSLDLTFIQRRKRAGTFDKAWFDEHYPGVAPDMDPNFYNLALPDQWAKGFFRGDERFFVENMHPLHPRLEGSLPSLVVRAFAAFSDDPRYSGGANTTPTAPRVLSEIPMRCDTVWMFPGSAAVFVGFHGSVPVATDDAGDVTDLVVACEELGAQGKPIPHYEAALMRRYDKDKGSLHGLSDSDLMPPRETGVSPTIDTGDIGRWVKAERYASKNARRGYERRVIEARKRLESVGLDASALPLPPPDEDPPDDPDQLAAYIERVQRESQEQAEKAKKSFDENREKMLGRAREVFKQNGMDFDQLLQKGKEEGGGPPKFTAEAHLEKIRAACQRGRAAGYPCEELEAQLEDPAFRSALEQQEEGMREMYRQSAHNRPMIAAAMDPDAKARTRLLVEMALEQGESLARRDFTGADFSGMTLKGADFSECFMESVDLSNADLTGAKLDRAVLANGNLAEAKFKGASLTGANLGAARAAEAVFDDADLSNAILGDADIRGACFANADLSGVGWHGTKLGDNDFSGVKAALSIFIKVKFPGCHFPGADLTRASFIDCSLDDANFEGANLFKTCFMSSKGERVNFRKTQFKSGVIMLESEFPHADFTEAVVEKACLRKTTLTKARAGGASFAGSDLSECDLEGAHLDRAVFTKALLIRTRLDGASLRGANLTDALLSKARIARADFTGANLNRADLSRVVGDPKTTFEEAIVAHVRHLPKADPPEKKPDPTGRDA
ncbi:MAG: DUF2169 domain-containing protein [Polyangiaceae bacterium]